MPDFEYSIGINDSDIPKRLKRAEDHLIGFEKTGEKAFNRLGSSAKKAGDEVEKVGKRGKFGIVELAASIYSLRNAFDVAARAAKAFTESAFRGVSGARSEGAFGQLAANAGQSSQEILEAMKAASAGTVDELTLIGVGIDGLNAKIAQTPAEFEKLIQSALALARARRIAPAEALERLVGGISRREVELLDELGIRLPEINKQLEIIAQRDFGKPATGLSAVQRESAFAEAVLAAAAESAGQFATNIDDSAAAIERAAAKMQDLQQDADEASVVLATKFTQAGEQVFAVFFGPKGLFPLFQQGQNVIATVAAAALAAFAATAGGIAQEAANVAGLIQRLFDIENLKALVTGGGVNPFEGFEVKDPLTRFTQNFQAAFEKIKSDFPTVFDPDFQPPAVPTTSAGPPPEGEELTKAREKTREAEEDAEIDHQRKLDDIIADGGTDRLDLLEKQARKRIDVATDNLREIEDIERKNAQAISDAGTDLGRDLEDIARKRARGRVELSKEAARDIVKIEQDTGQEIVNIRRRLAQTQEDAERNRDALGFIDAQRAAEREIETVQAARVQKIDAAKAEATERRDAFNVELQHEIEDANIVNERKLADLATRLDRELERQRVANDRKIEDNAIAEARQTEDLNEEIARRVEAAELANERRFEDLKRTLAEEYALVAANEEAKLEVQRKAAQETARLRRSATTPDELAAQQAGPGETPAQRRARNRRLAATGPQLLAQHGAAGIVPTGYPNDSFLIGASSGEGVNVTPAAAMRPSVQPLSAMATNISSLDRSVNLNGPVAFGRGMDPMDRVITMREFLEFMSQIR